MGARAGHPLLKCLGSRWGPSGLPMQGISPRSHGGGFSGPGLLGLPLEPPSPSTSSPCPPPPSLKTTPPSPPHPFKDPMLLFRPFPALCCPQITGGPAPESFSVWWVILHNFLLLQFPLLAELRMLSHLSSPGRVERVGSGAQQHWIPALPCHPLGEGCDRSEPQDLHLRNTYCLRWFQNLLPKQVKVWLPVHSASIPCFSISSHACNGAGLTGRGT